MNFIKKYIRDTICAQYYTTAKLPPKVGTTFPVFEHKNMFWERQLLLWRVGNIKIGLEAIKTANNQSAYTDTLKVEDINHQDVSFQDVSFFPRKISSIAS
jgi:hypothetical protein